MLETRAYTYVDAGNARAATPWSERCWSSFLGNTVSLRDGVSGREWLARPSEEIGLTVNGETLSLMDFQGGNWSEECNPHGAVLVCRLTGTAMTLFMRCIATHGSPGFLRELKLLNRTREPLAVTGCVLDHLALALPTGRKDLFRRVSERAITVGDDAGALIIGHDPEVAVAVNAEEGPVVTLRCRNDFVLGPGQMLQLPETYLLPYTGSFDEVSGREYAAFLRAIKDLRTWEQEVESASA